MSVVAGFILATNWGTILGALIFFLILLRKMVSYASILMAAIIVALTPILFIGTFVLVFIRSSSIIFIITSRH